MQKHLGKCKMVSNHDQLTLKSTVTKIDYCTYLLNVQHIQTHHFQITFVSKIVKSLKPNQENSG